MTLAKASAVLEICYVMLDLGWIFVFDTGYVLLKMCLVGLEKHIGV